MTEQALVPAPQGQPELARAMDWQAALLVYMAKLSAPGTRRQYSSAIRECFAWLGVPDVGSVSAADLLRFRGSLVARAEARTLSPSSVAQRLAALRSFWMFCRVTGLTLMTREMVHYALAPYTATVVNPYQVLTEEEQHQVLDHLRGCRDESAERDLALFMVLLGTGMRAAEVCSLQVRDILVNGGHSWSLAVRMGKGRKGRIVPLGNSVREALGLWLRQSGRKLGPGAADTYIFYGQGGYQARLSTRRLQEIVAQRVRAAGITDKEVSPHSLRHTMAIGLLRKGASVPVVQKLLGHSSIGTTQRYLDHIEQDELRKWAVEL